MSPRVVSGTGAVEMAGRAKGAHGPEVIVGEPIEFNARHIPCQSLTERRHAGTALPVSDCGEWDSHNDLLGCDRLRLTPTIWTTMPLRWRDFHGHTSRGRVGFGSLEALSLRPGFFLIPGDGFIPPFRPRYRIPTPSRRSPAYDRLATVPTSIAKVALHVFTESAAE